MKSNSLQCTLFLALTLLPSTGACRKVEERRYPNGQPIVRSEYKEDDDGRRIPHGKYEGWYENGLMRIKGRYVDGVQEGEWKSWHPSGVLWGTSQYQSGESRGTTSLYRLDGTLDWQIVYGDGRGDPTYIAYDAAGRKKWQGVGNVIRSQWVGTSIWFDENGLEAPAPWGDDGPLAWPGSGHAQKAATRPDE